MFRRCAVATDPFCSETLAESVRRAGLDPCLVADVTAPEPWSDCAVALLAVAPARGFGVERIAQLQALVPRLPIIAVTDGADQGLALECVRAGAQDAIAEARITLDNLPRMLLYAVERAEIQLQLRRMEDRLVRGHQMEIAARLAGGVAHDFNNLLQGVLGCASLALEEDEIPGTVRQRLLSIRDAALVAADLTRRLLAYTGQHRSEKSPVRVNEVLGGLDNVLAALTRGRCGVNLSLGRDLPLVVADPTQLTQVILNLVSNALDACQGPRSVVQIRTRLEAAPAARGRVIHGPLPPGPHVVIEVEDDGPGVTPEVFEHIEDAGLTTKKGGHGLGLPSVLSILDEHGAFLGLLPQHPRGTLAQVFFPVSTVTDRPVPTKSQARGGGGTRRPQVLLLDDEPLVLDVLRSGLERHGFEPLCAANLEEALRAVEAHPGLDAAVVDNRMPDASGQEALQALRERCVDLPVIIVSGHVDAEMSRGLLGGGAAAVLQKPFLPKALAMTLQSVLGNPGSRPRTAEGSL